MNLIFAASLIGILLSFSIFYSESFAEENKTIEIEVKYLDIPSQFGRVDMYVDGGSLSAQ